MKFLDHSDEAKEVLKQATIQWLFQACMLVEGQAVALAAVHTSRLRNSIDYVVDEAELIGYVGTNVEYAIYVEMGTGEFAENGMGVKAVGCIKTQVGNGSLPGVKSLNPICVQLFGKINQR